jgi:membrane protease YdiL (CAAX protease family)
MSKDSSKKPLAVKEPETVTPEPKIPWHPVLAVVAVVVIYFVSQFIGGFALTIYPTLRHWNDAQATSWINNSILAQFVYVLIAEGLTVLFVWQFLKYFKISLKVIGIKRFKKEDILYALMGYGIYFVSNAVVMVVATRLIPSLNVNQQQQLGFNNVSGVSQLILTAVSLIILPPIAEEILMRGFLYTSLKKSIPKITAALITSIIFATGHLEFGQGAPLLWAAAIDTFVLSLVLVYVREKTGRLWGSMGVHALNNSVAFISIYIFHVH